MVDKEELGASLFSRTLDIMENDPLEEIFALNMGDFVSEFLISEELAGKIGKSAKDKTDKLKSQLPVLTIYQIDENQSLDDIHQEKKDKKLTRFFDVVYINGGNSLVELTENTVIFFDIRFPHQ
jgi:hypothetical protein